MTRILTEKKLVMATHNQGKVAEFADLFKPYGIEVLSAADVNLSEPEETGTTFEENAKLKALAATKESGFPALADDSGFAVTALNGAPGVYSARFATTEEGVRDFSWGMQKIIDELGETQDRSAAFVCVLALAWPSEGDKGGDIECFEGRAEGDIVWPPRGQHGFGFDPMFQPHGYERTFAEMDMAEKKVLSHRAKAFQSLAGALF